MHEIAECNKGNGLRYSNKKVNYKGLYNISDNISNSVETLVQQTTSRPSSAFSSVIGLKG